MRGRQAVAAWLTAGAMVAATVSPVAALDEIVVQLDTWSSTNGRAYVGVKASGEWAAPERTREQVVSPYYSVWDNQGSPGAFCHAWWVTVHERATGANINPGSVITTILCGAEPAIEVRAGAFGDLSLYLAVAVDPASAPARTERSVTAELLAGWRDDIDDAIAAYVRQGSVRVIRWTIDFGDGTTEVFSGGGIGDRLATTHAYEPGQFDVVATARVVGEAYGAFFGPSGQPFEEVVPFSLDISNRASGVAALPIEYVPPVVSVGGSPSGEVPGSGTVQPDPTGSAEIFWPRGLPVDLYVRAIVETEGFMRSGGVVIGAGTTRLTGFRFLGGHNDATNGSRAGGYSPDDPLRLQWDTPLAGGERYAVPVELTVETTYEDGTVRSIAVPGEIAVTVIYSAVSH